MPQDPHAFVNTPCGRVPLSVRDIAAGIIGAMAKTSNLTEPDVSRTRTTVRILRILAVASIIIPLLILAGSGWMTWQQKRQEALDETLHLMQLVSDTSAKLFDSQLLALD